MKSFAPTALQAIALVLVIWLLAAWGSTLHAGAKLPSGEGLVGHLIGFAIGGTSISAAIAGVIAAMRTSTGARGPAFRRLWVGISAGIAALSYTVDLLN